MSTNSLRRRPMHLPMARLFALGTAFVLFSGCDAKHPLDPPTDQPSLLAAAQKGPSGLVANPLPGAISLGWQDNSPNETGFEVLRSTTGASGTFATIATTAAKVTYYTDSGLDPKQQYCYKVQALGQQKRVIGVSNTVCATPLPLEPLAASKVAAMLLNTWTVQITWTDNSAFEDGYEVQRCCQTGWIVVANLPANAVSYRDGGLVPNVRYYYTVRAKKDQGFSEYSNYASAITATAPPSAPVAGAYPASSSIITVYWYDNSGIAETFRVERSFDGGTSWTAFGSIAPGQTSLDDEGRTPEQQVCYRVYAANSLGESGPSNTACTAPPIGPTDLVATTVDYQTIDLTWADHSGVEDGYWVLRYDYSYGDWVIAAELPANTTTFTDTGLWSDTWYSYYVVASRDGGTSDYSNPVDALTAPLPVGALSLRATRTPHVTASSRGLTPA